MSGIVTKEDVVDDVVEKPKNRLTNIDTQYVSLVRAGANRQTQFMIVKADDEPGDSSAESNQPARHVCPHCNKPYFGAPPTCPHCKVSLKEAPDSDDTTDPVDPPVEDDVRKGESAQSDEGTGVGDLNSFFAQANSTVDALFVDSTIAQVMSAPPAVHDEPAASNPQQNCAEDAAQTQGIAHPATLEMEAKMHEAKAIAAKARAELVTERARVQQLKSAIGSSTALKTGEVSSSPNIEKRNNATGPTLWAGDLASEVARETSAKE